MAAINLADWIPEEYGGALIQLYRNTSAVDAAASRHEPMFSDIKKIPKDADADVTITPKGTAYTEDDEPADQVQLDAVKLTHLSKFNEEDVADSATMVAAVTAKKDAAVSNLALLFDNAALAVTVAKGVETTAPFESVYRAVSQYNSGSNRFAILTADNTSALKTDKIWSFIGTAEDSRWASEDLVVIASPAFRQVFRRLDATGANGRNLYTPANGGAPGAEQAFLGEYPIFWSRSSRLSTSATHVPTTGTGIVGAAGNALAVIGPRKMLIVGDRAPLESQILDPKIGIGALTDSTYLKMRKRVAFVPGEASAFATLEIATTAS